MRLFVNKNTEKLKIANAVPWSSAGVLRTPKSTKNPSCPLEVSSPVANPEEEDVWYPLHERNPMACPIEWGRLLGLVVIV